MALTLSISEPDAPCKFASYSRIVLNSSARQRCARSRSLSARRLSRSLPLRMTAPAPFSTRRAAWTTCAGCPVFCGVLVSARLQGVSDSGIVSAPSFGSGSQFGEGFGLSRGFGLDSGFRKEGFVLSCGGSEKTSACRGGCVPNRIGGWNDPSPQPFSTGPLPCCCHEHKLGTGPALGFGGALCKHASSRFSKKTCPSIGHRMVRVQQVQDGTGQDEARSDFDIQRLNV